MSYEGHQVGRVAGEPSGYGSLLSFDDVEARFVEAMHMLWRIEGGRWPFASDGPWHLFVRERHEHGYLSDIEETADRVARKRQPLTRAEMVELDETLGWLRHAPDRDRRLIVLAVRKLAAGAKRVPWIELLKPMGLTLGAHGLERRYHRAMHVVVKRVNATR